MEKHVERKQKKLQTTIKNPIPEESDTRILKKENPLRCS